MKSSRSQRSENGKREESEDAAMRADPCADSSLERGNAGPEANLPFHDPWKRWDFLKSSRTQRAEKRKRQESVDAARRADPMEVIGPSEFEDSWKLVRAKAEHISLQILSRAPSCCNEAWPTIVHRKCFCAHSLGDLVECTFLLITSQGLRSCTRNAFEHTSLEILSTAPSC